MTTIVLVAGALALAIIACVVNPLRRPLPTESDLSHKRSPFFELYYSSKYVRTIKRAWRGSGLEEYFKNITAPSYADAPLTRTAAVTIHAVGDLMCRRDLVPPASPHLWDDIGATVFGADLCMGNLEFAVNPSRVIEKLIRYSVPGSHAGPLLGDARFGRFDLVFLANNHINDSLRQGVVSTTDFLDAAGVLHVGANRTPDDVDEFPIIERNGIKIAVLAYTFSTNGIPLDNGFGHGVNVVRFNALRDGEYDPSIIHRHIALARRRGADIILSSHHWGVEFEYYPPPRLVRRAHELLEAGIDIIVGHHPHTLNPSEWYTTRDGRNTLCFYSLGNLTSYALIRPLQRMSLIAGITIEAGVDSQGKRVVRLRDASLTPACFHLHRRGTRADHRIVPVLACAQACAAGNTPAHLRPALIRALARDFRKYLWQEKAFRYR